MPSWKISVDERETPSSLPPEKIDGGYGWHTILLMVLVQKVLVLAHGLIPEGFSPHSWS